MTATIRIEDLAAPELTDRQRELQGLAEQYPVELRVESVLEAARAREANTSELMAARDRAVALSRAQLRVARRAAG